MGIRIEHAALWVSDLDRARRFYETYFGATAGLRYENAANRFSSYFLTFPDGGARLELMRRPGLGSGGREPKLGWAHVALSVGSEGEVDLLTARLRADGYAVMDGPRWTGDGYYESVVLDPDGNRIEITI